MFFSRAWNLGLNTYDMTIHTHTHIGHKIKEKYEGGERGSQQEGMGTGENNGRKKDKVWRFLSDVESRLNHKHIYTYTRISIYLYLSVIYLTWKQKGCCYLGRRRRPMGVRRRDSKEVGRWTWAKSNDIYAYENIIMKPISTLKFMLVFIWKASSVSGDLQGVHGQVN